jgi:alkylation response protein AidB-like acyl-CoA dehydrogenase
MRRALFEDEHEWFRESVAAFVDRELMPKRERFREQRYIDRETWLKAGEDGFLGLGAPPPGARFHGRIVGDDADRAAADGAGAGDHRVGGQALVEGAGKEAVLDEGARVEE